MFISFEGIDGCGKSTQIELLSEFFIKKGYDVIKLREPGGASLSEKIRELLLSSKNIISPVTELLLFEAARSNLVSQIIKPELEKGKVVICDRFFDSSIAYQGYGRGLNINNINLLNKIACNKTIPDITFYLDIDLETKKNRIHHKNPDRMELSDDKFFQNVIEGFRCLAVKEPDRIILLDGKREINEIFMEIKEIISAKFNY